MQSEDALTQQLAALGLKDGRVKPPAATDEAGEAGKREDEPEADSEDAPDDTPED